MLFDEKLTELSAMVSIRIVMTQAARCERRSISIRKPARPIVNRIV
jgi:hypothetical protein